jgi:hypothetical protein
MDTASRLDVPQLGSVVERARYEFVSRLIETQTYYFGRVPQQRTEFCVHSNMSTHTVVCGHM